MSSLTPHRIQFSFLLGRFAAINEEAVQAAVDAAVKLRKSKVALSDDEEEAASATSTASVPASGSSMLGRLIFGSRV